MKLITYQLRNLEVRLGAIVGDLVIDLARLGASSSVALPEDMQSFIEAAPSSVEIAYALLRGDNRQWPLNVATSLSNVKVLAPIPRPRKNIFGIGLNYVDHIAESAQSLGTSADLPSEPIVFSKPPTTVIGPGEAIEHNAALTQQLDWEVELAVVIGKTARKVTEEQAMSHVFGYTAINDVSARDCRRGGQWIFSKGQDTFAPMGPCLVTADEIPDPHNLDLWLKVNGVIKQSSNTRYLLFKIPALIADISSAITLEPGDIIATGTPSGVGAGRSPQEWLKPGDVVELEVQSVGAFRNPVVAV